MLDILLSERSLVSLGQLLIIWVINFIYYIVFYLDFVLSKQACYNFCEYVVLTLTYIMFLLCH